ncbi:MAG: hypothetical protein QGG94_01690 [Prochlorococcaceae cyanobacterium ETNP1_MAG_9]|nr:hypothetical protein [Prochlorococcaceae cyanobacterium ETNP1_MAG_9]
MYGLYDADGILRFVGGDREACMAYAKLFDLPSIQCCLVALPEPSFIGFNDHQKVHRAMNNN